MILAIALFGVLVIFAVAVAPEAYAQSIPSAQNENSGAQNSNSQTSNNPLGSIVPGLSCSWGNPHGCH
jgi:hypothetical protein